MSSFFEELAERVHRINSRLCVGIDPHEYLFENTMGSTVEEKMINWSVQLAEQTAEHAACFKINIAFFEAFGLQGLRALHEIIPKIKELAPVILDAKRGDISSTAAAYAKACFHVWNVRSVTINPYLGMESFSPFLKNPEAGLFLLCHTSNPSAGILQRRNGSDTLPLYAWVAKESANHPQSEQIGLVVGATQTDVFSTIRSQAPKNWLLCPGVGTQGGSLEETIKAGWGECGNLLISVSRAIAGAPDPAQKSRQLKEDIQRAEPRHSLSLNQQKLARLLIENKCILFGEFTLKSGIVSPLYIDLRKITSHPQTFEATVEAYVEYSKKLKPKALAALPFAGLPIASGLALRTSLPLCYPRPPKAHGTKKSIEGGVPEGSTVLLIDDLATRGASAIESLPIIRSQYKTNQLLVLIDRESGAKKRLKKHDVSLHSVFQLSTLLVFWKQESLISNKEYNAVTVFLSTEHS